MTLDLAATELAAPSPAAKPPSALEAPALPAGTAPLAVDATATAVGRTPGAPATAPAVGPGTRLAHFEIVRPLGHGGMGEVYLATDLALDRPVALKLLPTAVAQDRSRRERMIREARAQARLNHPNVAHLYFIGEDRGLLFFAMEYIDGETLAARLERGPLPAEAALELTRQAALGLREAHRHGFTHRDVKPSNLMIDSHGVLKVMDFGLVTDAVAAQGDPRADVDDAGVAASALVGTPLYMAPEQGQGRAVDHRADIYALGATLHHMLAGAPPFAGGSAAELQSAHASAARVSLVSQRGRRAVGLADAVVARMMHKRAADRPASYDELIALLDQANPARTRPAGFWVRGVAMGIDLVCAALVSIPFAVVADGSGNLGLLLYFLVLAPLMVARFGTTIGHALFELTITPARGDGRVRFLRAARRYLTMSAPLALGIALEASATDSTPARAARIAVTIVGLLYPVIELARAALFSPDAGTLWDRAADTRVRYRSRTSALAPGPTATT
ncbi:MAG: protein kinase [Kofleriaceae bacterium]